MSAYNLLRLVSHPRSGPLLPSEVKRREQRARVTFAPEELRRRLTTLQFHVTQQRGTERPFSGELTLHSAAGTYGCLVCGAALFTSESKFDSGSGGGGRRPDP
ncbi:methionine-R-sulfoxide reductase B3, mitochondrial-like isoform X3 [Lampetra fluviatilis]